MGGFPCNSSANANCGPCALGGAYNSGSDLVVLNLCHSLSRFLLVLLYNLGHRNGCVCKGVLCV